VSDVEREEYLLLNVGNGYCVSVSLSVNEFTVQVADIAETVSIGTALLGSCSHLLRYLRGKCTLWKQCSTTVIHVLRDFDPVCTRTWIQ